jgi:hypothetical protein
MKNAAPSSNASQPTLRRAAKRANSGTPEDSYVFVTSAECDTFLSNWRGLAQTLRQEGDERGAALIDRRAAELDAWLHDQAGAAASVQTAAAATGYSEDHLRRQITRGEVPNVGVKHKPAIRRGDLRPKHARSLAPPGKQSYNANADIRLLQIRRGE